ncbi:ZIP zinc transporter domain-containing protein [Hirsutella rhossiliensis]|uniref:ZIP zinc transporter domain-containing protein n=1 Tax=Hirsutella rhossiliensis TaxID=111463 RepID=A0A9P8MKY1_9HYPO|nr:ZIP zinc transporter domain-containing protein [Hirsutella rhossiliensis]KAH0956902.1 ZIP zinc transporter domain-containing protein [Hirsutella rhossiliensis]
MDADAKPQCKKEAAEYDLGLHVAGLFLVLAASCIGCGFPVVAKKVKWMKIPPKVFFACKHFGTGVLIATAFVHVTSPTAFESLGTHAFPTFYKGLSTTPGVIMMGSLFTFGVEMWLNAKTGGHSHGGPTGESLDLNKLAALHSPRHKQPPPAFDEASYGFPMDRKEPVDIQSVKSVYERHVASNVYDDDNARDSLSTMPAWFVVFYEQYIRQHNQMIDLVNSQQQSNSRSPKVKDGVFKKMSTNITLLEGGILFHSVFVGMTISITIDGFVILLVAILFHQMFEGLGLGSRIAAVPYPKGSYRPWLLVFAFGTTAPIGQAIGLITRSSYDPESAFGLIIVGVFNAISSGLLIYAALVDLLAEDFLSEEANHLMNGKKKAIAFAWVLAEPSACPLSEHSLKTQQRGESHQLRSRQDQALTNVAASTYTCLPPAPSMIAFARYSL